MAQAYKKAGGSQTAIGAIADKGKALGDKLTGNQIMMVLNPDMEKPFKKFKKVPKSQVKRFQQAKWQVYDPKKHSTAADRVGTKQQRVDVYRRFPTKDGSVAYDLSLIHI